MHANQRDRADELSGLVEVMIQIGRQANLHALAGMTPAQFVVLKWLNDQGAMAMSDLAERVGITMAGATGLVDRLVHAGFVARERTSSDRRVVTIRLTPSGATALQQDLELRYDRLRWLTAALSDKDLAELRRILSAILAAANPDPGTGPS